MIPREFRSLQSRIQGIIHFVSCTGMFVLSGAHFTEILYCTICKSQANPDSHPLPQTHKEQRKTLKIEGSLSCRLRLLFKFEVRLPLQKLLCIFVSFYFSVFLFFCLFVFHFFNFIFVSFLFVYFCNCVSSCKHCFVFWVTLEREKKTRYSLTKSLNRSK